MYCGCIYFLVHLSTVIWVNYLLLFYATQSLILIISFSCLFYQIGHIPITIFSQMLKHFVFFFFFWNILFNIPHLKKKIFWDFSPWGLCTSVPFQTGYSSSLLHSCYAGFCHHVSFFVFNVYMLHLVFSSSAGAHPKAAFPRRLWEGQNLFFLILDWQFS